MLVSSLIWQSHPAAQRRSSPNPLKSTKNQNYDGFLTPTQALNRATESHIFECELADACAAKKMSRIVRAIEHGHIDIEIPGFGPVPHGYLIFEIGKEGDTHRLINFSKSLDLAWNMRVLHQAAVGMQQLHNSSIAHQDLKKSNLIFFERDESKITDLGRAVQKGRPSLNDERVIPCQPINSPPELLFGYRSPEWDQRHFATDLYMLGNLTFSLFFDVTITSVTLRALPANLRPKHLGGDYGGDYQILIPVLRNVLDSIVEQYRGSIDSCIRDAWATVIVLLCEPDPSKRGHPSNHGSSIGKKFSAERFISAFREMEIRAKFNAGK